RWRTLKPAWPRRTAALPVPPQTPARPARRRREAQRTSNNNTRSQSKGPEDTSQADASSGPFFVFPRRGVNMIQTSEKTRFTEAEMATVRDTDLPDLLISLGYQVKRIGRYYTTQEMDSIRIKDRRTWFRYSEGIGGDAITFLQRFYNKSFPEAVEYLLTWH